MQIKLTNQFLELIPILNKLQELNYQAYFVGGAVRDLIINRPIHDIDITTNAQPAQIKKAFKHIEDYSGEKHGTVLVLLEDKPIEITTFRIDGDYLDGRHPKEVAFTNDLNEDLARRDFTINAIALDQDGVIIDPFGGLDDIQNKLIKAVGDPDLRFDEDGLRILRAIRFAGQLNFRIDEATFKSIGNQKGKLTEISTERKRDEIEKLMLAPNANFGLDALYQSQLYQYLPTSQVAFEFKQPLKHPLANKFQAWYCFRSFYQFENIETNRISFIHDWKLDNEISNALKTIDDNFLNRDDDQDNLKLKIFRMSKHFSDFIQVGSALGFLDEALQEKYQKINQALPIENAKDLKITGTDLINQKIAKAGPELGQLLNQLLTEVILGQIENDSSFLSQRAREILND